MKKVLALLLAVTMLIGLCGCGVSREDVIGTWEREVVYLESYGCDTTMYEVFLEDGSEVSILVATHTGEILKVDDGTWEIEGREVAARSSNHAGTTYFKYSGGKLKNGENVYTRSELPDQVLLDLLYYVS